MSKLAKPEADYKTATVKGKNCGTCVHMQSNGSCTEVAGPVDRRHVCKLYRKAR